MVFFCENAAGFCSDIGMDDEAYYDALVRMFEQAVKAAEPLHASDRDVMKQRLDRVRVISGNFGYGVDSDLNFLFAKLAGD
jgi:hypothetical protein